MFSKPRWGGEKLAPTVKHLTEAWEVLQFRKSAEAEPFRPPPQPLRPDVVFLAEKRFGAIQKVLDESGTSYPLSPLLAAFVEQGRFLGVGREALRLACMIETGAASFRPGEVALHWASSAMACPNCSKSDLTNGANDVLLLGEVLEDVEKFMYSVEAQLGLTKGMSRKERRQNTLKAGVSFPKVKKAETLWWKVDPENAWPRSARPRAQQGWVLLKIMQHISPNTLP